jgi:hypothetical protein
MLTGQKVLFSVDCVSQVPGEHVGTEEVVRSLSGGRAVRRLFNNSAYPRHSGVSFLDSGKYPFLDLALYPGNRPGAQLDRSREGTFSHLLI